MTPANPADDAIRLTIPAASSHLALARAATASICARLGFTIDRLDDMTLAIDEAVALMLSDAVPGTQIRCEWTPEPNGLRIDVTSVSSSGRPPRRKTFSWIVMSALVDELTTSLSGNEATLTFRTARNASVAS
ncbi:MAG: hypothetical protein U0990_05375 [Candidatus Nanopelagicales bacterium]|nr:hypothetical protein [Candidatus Nanopelagicales bacterium]MDZ4249504.1 hypothetical protein [Candidatus Nanopelagicales bacterium]